MKIRRESSRSLVLPIVLVLAAAFLASGLGSLGSNDVTGMQVGGNGLMSGGKISIQGKVVEVSNPIDEQDLYIKVDLNGDDWWDKLIVIPKKVNTAFWGEKYPVGSVITFTNLQPYGGEQTRKYHVTKDSDKEHSIGDN